MGKSTLLNTLAAEGAATVQLTGAIRAHDSMGRHTTTARSLHPVAGGDWMLDAPGIRTLHLREMAEGLDAVFAEITELATQCKFANCTHYQKKGGHEQDTCCSQDRRSYHSWHHIR